MQNVARKRRGYLSRLEAVNLCGPQDLHKLVQKRKYKKAVSRTKFQESLASVTQKKKDISSVNCKNHPTRFTV